MRPPTEKLTKLWRQMPGVESPKTAKWHLGETSLYGHLRVLCDDSVQHVYRAPPKQERHLTEEQKCKRCLRIRKSRGAGAD